MNIPNSDSVQEISYEEALRKASSLCAASEKCTFDVREKLIRWGATEDITERVLEALKKNQFLDEQRYANFYVKDKFRFNKWGKIKLRLMLASKQVEKEAIAAALDTIDQGEYESTLFELLKGKLKGLKYNQEYEKQGKLFRFAQGRGFESDVIDRIYRQLPKTE